MTSCAPSGPTCRRHRLWKPRCHHPPRNSFCPNVYRETSMIKKILKWIGFILAGLLGLLALAAISLYVITEGKLNQVYDVSPSGLVIPSDPATIARGEHLVNAMGLCMECHTDNFSGEVFDEGLLVGTFSIANLTSGKGGVGGQFSDEDWVRAIRYGIDPEGKTLINMPPFNHFSDGD